MLKSLGKGETLISCDVIFQFSCYSVFYSCKNCWELNMAKSKVLVFKTEANWGSFPLQTRYLVKKYISTCFAHHIHVVHFTLVLDLLLGNSFWLRWPKTCFWAPDPLVYDDIL